MLVDTIPESPILALIDRIFRMRAAGDEMLGLHIGEPDFDTPPGIRAAAARAMEAGLTHYTSAQGMPGLRSAIAERLARRHHIPARADDVTVMPSKFAIYATILATTSPGDEVLIPNPTYLFEEPVRLAGARPVFVPLRPDYSLDLAALEAAVTPRTRLILLATPGNPTGRVLDRRDLQATIEIARDRDLTVVSDETYESLVYEGTHVASAALAYGAERVVTLGSFSKTFAMTGWRAGYAVAPPPIRARIVKVVEHTLTCIPPFVQEACRWALENAEPDAERFRSEFRARRDALVPALESIPGFHLDRPQGAFYTFPTFDLPFSSREFCERLLAEEHVAVVPGVSFGPAGEHHVRVSYTRPRVELMEGAERIRRFVERHRSAGRTDSDRPL